MAAGLSLDWKCRGGPLETPATAPIRSQQASLEPRLRVQIRDMDPHHWRAKGAHKRHKCANRHLMQRAQRGICERGKRKRLSWRQLSDQRYDRRQLLRLNVIETAD
eukprot:365718-Chlamydomonas_euryale.AAC.32